MGERTKRNTPISNADTIWIKDKLSEIDMMVTKLHQTVIGDKVYGQKGLVEQVNEHRKYIDTDKSLKAKVLGGSIVLSGVWTVILKYWSQIFN